MERIEDICEAAKLASVIVLASGGETYRAEETADSIGRAFGCEMEIVALPTGLNMTIARDGESLSSTVRVKQRTVDLKKLDEVNGISRALYAGAMPLDEARRRLKALHLPSPGSRVRRALLAGGSAAMFAVMFGGGWFEFLVAGLVSCLVQTVLEFIPDRDSMSLSCLVAGFLSAALALTAYTLRGGGSAGLVIWSIMMPYLPGLAFTNGIRDAMRGDMVSGGARLTDALMRAVVLASGAGIAIGCYLQLGGASSWLISLAL